MDIKKKRIPFTFLAIAFLLAAGCISFKVEQRYPSDNQLEQILMCTGIEKKKGVFAPVGQKDEFTMEDGKVFCYVRLKEVSASLRLRWKWYSPEEKLIRVSDELVLNPGNKYIETATAYDVLDLTRIKGQEGMLWTVTFFINGDFVCKKMFPVALTK